MRSLLKILRNCECAELRMSFTLGSALLQSIRLIVSASVSLSGALIALTRGCIYEVLMSTSVVGVTLIVVAFFIDIRTGFLVLL